MNLKIFSYAILIAFSTILINKTFAQIDESADFCGTSEVNFQKLHIPTSTPAEGEYLKALFIFVTFKDDDAPNKLNCIWLQPTEEDNGTRPINPYTRDHNIVSNTEQPSSAPFMQRYEQYTISDYYCQMSGGQLDFIGDEIYFKLPEPSTYYKNTLQWRRPQLNYYILQYVQDNFPEINFADYDNWHKEGNNWVWGGDNEAEMIVIQFRKIPDNYETYYWDITTPGVGGEAHLFETAFYSNVSITLDGILMTNDDGITATQGVNRTTHLELVLEHEISHHIFADEFNHPGFNPWHVSIGMMTEGHGTSTYCMLPMERSMEGLGWLNPIIPEEVSSQIFTLRDEFEYGDAIKITVPGTTPAEYFWVTNHQKKSRYDGVSRGSNTCFQLNHYEQDPYCDVGKGLFVFHESYKWNSNNVNGYSSSWGDRHFAFDLKSANGKWNWAQDTLINDQTNLSGDFWIQKTIAGNPSYGINTYNKLYLRNNPWEWSAQLCNRDKCWNPPNYKITADFHGNGKDGFNIGNNELLSPYSNPASNSCESPSANNEITIRLLSQDPVTGSMQVKVYFDDDLALAECPPAKPRRLKVDGSFVVPESFHPHLVWEANSEPDFITSGHYNIYRGASYNCDVEPNYGYIGFASSNETEYTDNQVLLYTGRIGGVNCGNYLVTYSYKITAVDATSLESVKSDRDLIQGYMDPCLKTPGSDKPISSNNEIPQAYSVSQNYPNPFNPVTNISYDLPKDGYVSLKIYDMSGREIQTLISEFKQAGRYIVSFNGLQFSSGVYFYKIQSGNFVSVKRMVLIK
ncbi:MAG: T9SS type A sorting domain-containing protein [Ignavibacteriae bacterium]|nr:T9SS type A sorting domain-containing protein [Ignavibacteriota bacterium]